MRKLFLTALVLGAAIPALAQPQGGNPPMARGAQQNPNWDKMTPAERRAAIRKTIEDTVRGSMTHLGYDDKAMQDAVVATAMADEEALIPVREAHRKLTTSLFVNPKAEKETTGLLLDLRTAVDEAKADRENRIKVLEGQIEFSKKPGLSAFLSLLGITGDESTFMSGILGSFTSAMANMRQQLG